MQFPFPKPEKFKVLSHRSRRANDIAVSLWQLIQEYDSDKKIATIKVSDAILALQKQGFVDNKKHWVDESDSRINRNSTYVNQRRTQAGLICKH